MLLQRIKEKYSNPDDTFYISLDHYWFGTHQLQDLIEFLYKRGIMEFYIDEVHKYKGWSTILKNLVDQYMDLRIVYTGSSLLEIDNAKVDMSRRQTSYMLKGMSFREYLAYEDILHVDAISLEGLLKNHITISIDITAKTKILVAFEAYLRSGIYPFYKEAGLDFLVRLKEVVDTVIESDLPAVEKITYDTIEKCKKLLMIIAENVPMQPNVARLSTALGTTRDSLLKLLYNLDKAEILELLTVELKNYKKLVNPENLPWQHQSYVRPFTQDRCWHAPGDFLHRPALLYQLRSDAFKGRFPGEWEIPFRGWRRKQGIQSDCRYPRQLLGYCRHRNRL